MKISVFFILFTLDLYTIADSMYEPYWSYDDQKSWPGKKCALGGARQSPIDIRTADVIEDLDMLFIKYGPLQLIGYDQTLVSAVNNAHTIQFSTEGEQAIHPVLTGGPLQHRYRLEQLHFHWLSEHSVDGNKYPMEIHFVHVRSDLTVINALNFTDGLAILSVFCKVVSELDDEQQDAISEVTIHIPNLQNPGNRISGVLMNMSKLFTSKFETYFTYQGSLTSPECNEAVVWIIFETPILMTDAQYQLFTAIGKSRFNFRSLQKLRKHEVYKPITQLSTGRKLIRIINDVLQLASDFFRNITGYVAKGFGVRT